MGAAMTVMKLDYVNEYVDRTGKVPRYFRRGGKRLGRRQVRSGPNPEFLARQRVRGHQPATVGTGRLMLIGMGFSSCHPILPALQCPRELGGLSMTLGRGQIIGYDNNRMSFEFTMTDAKGKMVHCKISSTAMDELAGIKGTRPSERDAQFLKFRDKIERIASDLFDKGVPGPVGLIHVFRHHVG
jgi:Protein of unknown function (DUF1488)